MPSVKLENEALALQIIPQWGAKVHSLTHKRTGSPLLLENPTHMPMNNGVRKPFASGGIEWNWGGGRGQIGHSVFSEEPAFVARVEDPDGDHVRVYEYDRFNGTLWQVTSAPPQPELPVSYIYKPIYILFCGRWMCSSPTALQRRGQRGFTSR